MSTTRARYAGSCRKLVLAFDIGTIYSGISYSILNPDQVPEIKGVTKFPGQHQVSGSSKIPSIICYDFSGKVQAIGAEAIQDETAPEDGERIKVEWFKLHLRPKSNSTKDIHIQHPPLPPGKTVIDVLADFLSYLFRCARTYIEETHANGVDLWLSFEKEIEFVLSHPNGWESQQGRMRKAAVLAGLIPDDQTGQDRITFITEGKANLYFYFHNRLPQSDLETDGAIVVDAGGVTVDISTYAPDPSVPTSFNEIDVPQRHYHGSFFVSRNARFFLADFLSESVFLADLDNIIHTFDQTTKHHFRNTERPQTIKFGGKRENEPKFNIHGGKLKLPGPKVADFFEPSITCIVESVRAQCEKGCRKLTTIILVGGFATSDWLYTQVMERLKPDGLTVIRPEGHVNKAVTDGALSDYIDHHPSMSTTTHCPHRRNRQKLVLAFNIGTTFSGIAYSLLDLEQGPETTPVTKFPRHVEVQGSSRIPTVLYYDTNGYVSPVGPETNQEGIYETAVDLRWMKTEWFRDHLGPEGSEIIPSLPFGKTAIDVLADFLRYLFWCARAYIEGTHANGVDLWLSVEREIEFVLSHPNGWESRQTWMRKAAVSSGLILDDHSGHNRIAFITEGEANLHFSIHNGLSPSAFEDGNGVVIVDAGEETIDISGYARNSNIPPSFDEIGAPQCHFQGLVSVSMYARMFFTEFLSKSIFLEDLDDIVLCFERSVKPCFRNSEKPQFIKFGSARDNDASCNIRFGQLKLAGEKVAEFFEPSIQCIVAGVHEWRKEGKKNFTNVVLVGKFAASDWLYTQVAKHLKSDGFSVFRPDYHMDKAIVEGALFNYIDRHPKIPIMRSLCYASRKLVLAFDIGTTHSGISYCILASGTVPQIKSVTRFRGQVNESLKIPTIIYYDASGKVRAVGAEAVQEDNYGTAEEEGWVKVEWFKLLLSTTNMTDRLPALPPGKTVVDILADFLHYLFKCTQTFIEGIDQKNVDLWSSFKEDIDFVISCPNGWEGQQAQIRKAAVLAGLIPDNQSGQDRIAFVSEAEASLRFLIYNGLLSRILQEDDHVIVVDAGGGTIYVSSYTRNPNISISHSSAAPQCHLHGSVFVSIHARSFLKELLSGSEFLNDLDDIVRSFDRTTKLRFRNSEQLQFIKFGSKRNNQRNLNILNGHLILAGAKVAEFFEPSIISIVESVRAHSKTIQKKLTSVVMVGGFAASDWLYTKVAERLKPDGFTVIRPDSHINEAIADGVLSCYISSINASTTDRNRSATTEEQTVLAFDSTSGETQVVEEGFPDLSRRSLLMHVPSSVTHRKLVLAFDVGTTFSGISYCILDPWKIPEVRSVARFPAGDEIRVFLKIPTAIYYDTHGKVRATGAEVSQEGIYETAEEEGWTKAEWFKLHLHREGNATASQLPPLPPGKSVIDVLADFLRYLFQCTQTYIEGAYPRDANLWSSLVNDIDFLLSHPNGWGVPQQTQMREAAVFAGLVPDDRSSQNRIFFVTEGEANLHFAIHNGLSPTTLMESEGVIIVDAGGGTIDISDFACNADIPTFNEIAPPQCHFHGSVFVGINARNFLEVLLSESPFIEDLQHIVRCFDRTTKLRFRTPEAYQFIKFGSTRDNDLNCNIRFGQLKLEGDVVAGFFEPSIQCIIEAIYAQHRSGQMKSKNVLLVGGFAANDWLYTQVVERLKPDGFTVIRPDHGNKAVADGALYYHIQHLSMSNPADPHSNTLDGNTEGSQRNPDQPTGMVSAWGNSGEDTTKPSNHVASDFSWNTPSRRTLEA